MANFTDVTVTGLCQAALFEGPLQTYGQNLTAGSAPAALVTSANNNVLLPGCAPAGPMLYTFGTVASGAILNGIAMAEPARAGQLVCLINGGANALDIAANAGGSTAGNRFSTAC